ncbi:MAG: hypothetical protein EPN40_06780 [Rhodanobacteraceae bacterium]|nr:MAG: hypothetical protein EPN40_06780 [Rhodanobacteraceae bacterium]
MSEISVLVHAIGASPEASLPERGLEQLVSARYLRIVTNGSPPRAAVFATGAIPREGAEGIEIHVRAGQLGLAYNERVSASATAVSVWAYRRFQLNTANGYLVVGTFAVTSTAAWIDTSLAIGKWGTMLFHFGAATLFWLGMVSLLCKLASAVLAFLLALWFRK